MSRPSTVPHVSPGWPVRSLRVVVTDGPDKGKRGPVTGDRVSVGTAENNQLVLTDPTVSRYHLELKTNGDGIEVVDLGSTNGTLVEKVRVLHARVAPKTKLKLGKTTLRVESAGEEVRALHAAGELEGLIGASLPMRQVMAQLTQAARTDSQVLVVGESGTGKEAAVRALHQLGARASQPFVAVDCGALSTSLIASELFGHERGSFTGAERQRPGAFERAQGGTLFLDEIGELAPELQPALLGVLERKKYRRVGGDVDLPADVRVVSATHRDLRAEVNAGRFRVDLFYRLAVVVIELPPLRERLEDVPALVEHFLEELGASPTKFSDDDSVAALARHRWPGNVRELRNLIEAAVVLGELPRPESKATVTRQMLGPGYEEVQDQPYRGARSAVLGEFERLYLSRLIQRAKGNVAAAARLAKMDRSHLIELLQRHGMK